MPSKKASKTTKSRKSAKTAPPAKKPAKSKSRKSSPKPAKAMRLTFSYQGDDVRLISQERTEMVVPPSDAVRGYGKHKGFWAELRNESDKTLYRSVLHNPTRNDAEVFPETPGESISREPAPKRRGVFVVVVPDTPKGDEVLLCRSKPSAKGPEQGIRALARKPATELKRFKLKK